MNGVGDNQSKELNGVGDNQSKVLLIYEHGYHFLLSPTQLPPTQLPKELNGVGDNQSKVLLIYEHGYHFLLSPTQLPPIFYCHRPCCPNAELNGVGDNQSKVLLIYEHGYHFLLSPTLLRTDPVAQTPLPSKDWLAEYESWKSTHEQGEEINAMFQKYQESLEAIAI